MLSSSGLIYTSLLTTASCPLTSFHSAKLRKIPDSEKLKNVKSLHYSSTARDLGASVPCVFFRFSRNAEPKKTQGTPARDLHS